MAAETDTPNLDEDLSREPQGSGPVVIRRFARTLPNRPGVYRMIDAKGDVIYVGKARSLKARVMNYTRLGGHTNRIAAMIAGTADMEFVTTETEAEALLLEANLIKKHKPRYNVTLRDDKSFPYILIARDHPVPQIAKHRGARTRKGEYYGPFASAGAVNRTINALQKAFLLRSCSDSVFENRTRPCLLFQIKRCSAPCTGEIDRESYEALVTEAEEFLEGKSVAMKAKLAREMQEASERLDFETAARYRDRISAMSFVTSEQGINPETVDEADLFALVQQGGHTCVQVFFFRSGQNWGNRAYFPRADRSLARPRSWPPSSLSFTMTSRSPRVILLSHALEEQELLAEAFCTRAGHKIEILQPQRGEKRSLLDHALEQCPRSLGPPHGRIPVAGAAASGCSAGLRPRRAAKTHRSFR